MRIIYTFSFADVWIYIVSWTWLRRIIINSPGFSKKRVFVKMYSFYSTSIVINNSYLRNMPCYGITFHSDS